jgi:hypothetical protein
LAKEIHDQGRWPCISKDLLASFCQLLALSQECMKAILADGALVAGARSERERVKHPLWPPLSPCQSNLIRLARANPLVNARADLDGAALDDFIDRILAE